MKDIEEIREEFEQFARPMVREWPGLDPFGGYGMNEVQAMWLAWRAAIKISLPERESIKPGDIIPSNDPDFSELVAVPHDQMQDISRTLGEAIKKCQYSVVEAMDGKRAELVVFKGDLFCMIESAQMFVNNWVKRKRNDIEGEQS